MRNWKRIPKKHGPDWLKFSKNKAAKIQKKAIEKYSKELDIVTFIKSQLLVKAMFRTIFSKRERFLIKNHPKFKVIDVDSSREDSESKSLKND